ncbi:MAG: putative secreted hydrolase [Nocardioidaceae bacterium]|nr:putative secreted hydrolase [Nocardioidaceae bacterium]
MPVSEYVALGDSYAAGVGGGDERDTCWRAEEGYPVLVARALGVDLAYDACIGATTADVLRDQVGDLGPATTYVTLTIGGNDLGFVPVLVSAAEPAWFTDSDTKIDAALRVLRTVLPGRLDQLYAAVREKAPDAKVVVAGYPRLFNGDDCSLLTFFSGHEMTRLDAAADELSAAIRDASERAGFTYVDVRARFRSHELCDDDSWLHGVSLPLQGSFHPKPPGHADYAEAVGAAFPKVDRTRAREPRITRGRARRGSAPTFSLPDLMSRRSMAGAAAFGLDPDHVATLAGRARLLPPDVTAQEELQQLDADVAERRFSRPG